MQTRTHTVTGAGGVDLCVDETGNENGRPILFVHGWAQSRRSWRKQLDSDLASEYRLVALDNRGHGDSGKPRGAYDDPEHWAGDLQAVIDELALDQPVLVAWSYGGLIVSDYLSVEGDDDIAGVNLVGAISEKGTDDAARFGGEEFVALADDLFSTDAETSTEALSAFLDICVADPLPADEKYFMLGFNAACPPRVRQALQERSAVHEETLRNLDVPVLVTHGEEDQVVLPGAGEKNASLVPDAELSRYADVGHSPFWEAPERFNEELRAFVERC